MVLTLPAFDLFRHKRAEIALLESFAIATASAPMPVADPKESRDRSNKMPAGRLRTVDRNGGRRP